ncbi:MAG TPA: helix-turn-helix transcriptional regulator [Shinella sp.]|uniref:helix-turn-helix transcriptional regulator n=1 Tax=Shinella sp. TaxID=1870904 RepID=UPI002E11917B|nr:helix-turn-helix transcriptional regulator [Shinella sp.]
MDWQTKETSLLETTPILVGDAVELAAHFRQLANEIEQGIRVVEGAPSQLGPPLQLNGRIVCLCIMSQARVAAARTSDGLLARLTSRQREILLALMNGHTAKAIATMLGIHPRTVETHVHHIHKKAGTHRTVELMEIAFSQLD